MESLDFVREIKLFLFYSKYLWPLHRSLLGKTITPRCRKCIISANLSPLNQDGICSQCESPVEKKSEYQDSRLGDELSILFQNSSQKSQSSYDALVMFSGGKDSTYLVRRLTQEHPKLRLLLFTVDNTFMSPIALKNVQHLVHKLDLDHVIYRPPAAVMDKMFRYAFLHLNEKGCSGTVDQFDGDFFFDVGRNWAAENRIPLIISGLSKTQVTKILKFQSYESPPEMEAVNRTKVAHINLTDIFSPEEMRFWWHGQDWQSKFLPRFICPFYAWNPSEDEILQQISKQNLLPEGSTNPIYTNSQLVPLMAIVDMCKYGYSSFESEFSQNVRDGKADPVLWRNIFELSEYAAKTGKFISKSVDQVLARLKLSRTDLGIPR